MRSHRPLLAMAFGLATLTGGAAQADTAGRFSAITLSGSDRLAIFALSDPRLPPAARAQRDQILRSGGFGLPAGVRNHAPLDVTPILSFDPNLNGGLANDTLTIGGLTFVIDPAAAAVAGVLVGGAVQGRSRIALGGPTAVDLRYGGMIGHAPAAGLGKAMASVEACVLHLRTPALGVHACADVFQSRVDLGTSTMLKARSGLSATFDAVGGYHDLTVEVGVNRVLGGAVYTQPWVGAELTSALDSGMATGAMIQIAAPVAGRQVARTRIELDATMTVKDRPVSLRVNTQTQAGGRFLGQPRQDRIDTLSLSTQMSPRLDANISLSRVQSNADFFDDQSLGFSLNFRM